MPVLLILILVLCAPVFGQQEVTPRVGVSLVEHKLSLQEAVETALKNNLEIEIEKVNTNASRQAYKGVLGAYDTVLGVAPTLESRVTPTANSLAAPDGKLEEHGFSSAIVARQQLPWQGMSLSLSYDNARVSSNNPFTSLTPYWFPRLGLALNLPLVRGRATDPLRTELVIRKHAIQISDAEFELRVIDVLTRVETSYWNLVAALQATEVEADGVKLAREQLARNQRMIASGTLAPVELAASEAELQRRIDNYYTFVGVVTETENALKLLMAPNREDTLWGERILPTESRRLEPPDRDLKTAMTVALDQRLELKSLALQKSSAEAATTLAKDQTKPVVTLTGNYINSGLAGTKVNTLSPISEAFSSIVDRVNELSVIAGLPPLPTGGFGSGGVPPSFIGGYGKSVANMFSGDYPSVSAGVVIEWTPRNRTAQAALAEAELQERKLRLMKLQLEQGIEAQVRSALQSLETGRQRIIAAQAGEKAAQEKYESEVRLFQTGESTNFLVLTRQNDLLSARRRVVEAVLELNKAVARLNQSEGTTLEAHQVRLP